MFYKKRKLNNAQKKFQNMAKKQKEDFLSNDLSERIIRVEQRVSTRFNKFIPYYQTEYYKSMSKAQKINFEKYLKDKGKKKFLVLAVLLIPLLILGFLNFGFTGDVVKKDLTEFGININFVFVFIFFLFAIILILALFMRLKRKNKLDKHIGVIDNFRYAK